MQSRTLYTESLKWQIGNVLIEAGSNSNNSRVSNTNRGQKWHVRRGLLLEVLWYSPTSSMM